jgi:hypothetical protein
MSYTKNGATRMLDRLAKKGAKTGARLGGKQVK